MTQSIIGPWASLRYLKDYNAHISYWREVNPAYALAYIDKSEHLPYIFEYAAEFPDTMIVGRVWHPIDGGFHLAPEGKDDHRHYISSPKEYHDAYGAVGRIPNGILNLFNEPDGKADDTTIQRLVDWFTEYIPIAVQNKTKSVLFNWGKMQPRIINGLMDSRLGVVLQLASLYPELFHIGLHFYGPEPITEVIRSYVALCAKVGIRPLRVIGTEWGNDDRVGGGIEAAWEIDKIKHELAPFIQAGVLVGLNRFQDGNSGGWQGYAIEDDKAYKDEIKRAAKAGEITAPDIKRITWTIPVIAKPDDLPVTKPLPSTPQAPTNGAPPSAPVETPKQPETPQNGQIPPVETLLKLTPIVVTKDTVPFWEQYAGYLDNEVQLMQAKVMMIRNAIQMTKGV